jgi:hypothetical protein
VVTLQGVVPDCPEEVLVQLSILTPEDVVFSAVHVLPAEIQLLLDQFAILFEEPAGLPPSRACDHQIPLLPGARPVNIRPYRYPPALKTEIEKQVADMLLRVSYNLVPVCFRPRFFWSRRKMAPTGFVWIFVT